MNTLKYCPRCRQWKEPATFSRNKRKPDGLDLMCKACDRARALAYREAHPQKVQAKNRAYREAHRTGPPRQPRNAPPVRPMYVPLKRCSKCRESKPLDQFPGRSSSPDGKDFWCKACHVAKPRKPWAPRPPRSRPAKPALILAPPLEQAITAFLNAKQLKRPKTLGRYVYTLRGYAEHLVKAGLPHWPAEPEGWADNINSFLATRKARGLKDQTLDGLYRDLRCFLRWVRRRKKIQGDVVELIEMIERPSRSRPLPKVVSETDAAALLATLKLAAADEWRNMRDYALIALSLDSGARIGELAALTRARLDMTHRTITATETKTGADRTIVFSAQAAAPLACWLDVRKALDIADLEYIFVGRQITGQWGPLAESGIRRRLAVWQERAGIEKFNFHRLRHSYAVYVLRTGGDLLDIQKQLGHASVATTAVYTRVDDAGRGGRHSLKNPLDYLKGAAL